MPLYNLPSNHACVLKVRKGVAAARSAVLG